MPSNEGEFKLIDELKKSENINTGIKKFAKMLDINIDEFILNENIEIKDLNIQKYTLDDLILQITKVLENVPFNEIIVLELLKFVPVETHPFYNENSDIKNIYRICFKEIIKKEIIVDTKIESFWNLIKKKIMNYIQIEISHSKGINANRYVEMINQYN